MSSPYTIRWGIIAAGNIAEDFVKDLVLDPVERGSGDIAHEVVAVASASSLDKAERFIAKMARPNSPDCRAYSSYKELVDDSRVDVVYVASPHSHHFQNVMLALHAGKHVLCEKAFTVNAEQARIMCKEAEKRGLFLMEAVWTRFFPICYEIRKIIRDGGIGDVLRVFADICSGKPQFEREWGHSNRMIDNALAGGTLLDLGIYSLTWAFQTLYQTLPDGKRKLPAVTSQMSIYKGTDVDESVNMLLQFPESAPNGKFQSHAIATAGFRTPTDLEGERSGSPVVRIQGTEGEIKVFGHSSRPTGFWVVRATDSAAGEEPKVKKFAESFPGDGRGMYWEADEVARCLRDGKKESEVMPLAESVVIMEMMDEVRRQNQLQYPAKIESTDFPLTL